ncbi:hypothetical protein EUTSA_v10004303mg [Eutrema salsugineum]|uniref:DDT domain-containing protein n=1 Tax=Eutrema salsugineum TaxID=72664 RepID=V4KXH8_EUTSA|nr:DDT domain-containing protein DDR4 [Eutrema salsugineum]ESQ32098.1 hypothetical protein EUTSA_v10004303mg [Eutrema salsugineum]
MVMLRQRTMVATGEPEPALEKEGLCGDDLTILVDDSSTDSAVKHLRGRWELASVLNFLNVFGPLVSEKLKLTAEEIETGLIDSNATNAQLHIALLKGILPIGKSLDQGDAWITVLCKKLTPWWPLIAEGEIPVTANKGEEIVEYKGLDPTNRLQLLKALCELRVQQDDARTFIQENAKQGALDSGFQKRKFGGDGKKISYWFDGNDIQGYRLYREVNDFSKSAKARKNACSDISSFCWETDATNLDEFQRVARELSSCKASSLAAIGQMIETDAIPVVEKYHKKKERAIKKKMKQEMAISVNFSRPMRITRSCRNRMPATYTFDEYEKMISEAVKDAEEMDREDEEGKEQQSASLVVTNDNSEGNNKMKSTEEVAPESDNDDVKEMEKCKEDSEGKREFSVKNRLRQRLTRNSAL